MIYFDELFSCFYTGGSDWWKIPLICIHALDSFLYGIQSDKCLSIPVTEELWNPYLTAHTPRKTSDKASMDSLKNPVSPCLTFQGKVATFTSSTELTQLCLDCVLRFTDSTARQDEIEHDARQSRDQLLLKTWRWDLQQYPKHNGLKCLSAGEWSHWVWLHITINGQHCWKVIAISSSSTPQSPSCSSLVLTLPLLNAAFKQRGWEWVS